MELNRHFLRALAMLSATVFVLFSIEFLVEWNRNGRPDLDVPSYAGKDKNVKMVDVLSPVARAYNNMLAMLIAAVGLAIPITANMHTPKLIEMFLRDPVNRLVLIFGAVGAGHVLFVAYLVGPEFAPVWAYRLAVAGAIAGWILVIPYFFYVIRFLDPSNILARLKMNVMRDIERAKLGKNEVGAAHDRVRDGLQQIGTIVLKSIDRADRGVAAEGIWKVKQLLDHYRVAKVHLPPAWFVVERRDLVGLSSEALEILNSEKTWLEHAALWQLYLVYMSALTKAPDTLSALSDAVRVIGVHAAKDKDDRVLELALRIFNNFLREAIRKKDMHAVHDLLYQYRRLGQDIMDRPRLLEGLGTCIRYYSEGAVRSGLDFVPQMMVFDLGKLVELAYENNSPASASLLHNWLAIPHASASGLWRLAVKGKIMVGAHLLELGKSSEAAEVRAVLSDVSAEVLVQAERDLLSLDDKLFWEVTDRQLNFEYVPPDRRESVKKFFASMRSR